MSSSSPLTLHVASLTLSTSKTAWGEGRWGIFGLQEFFFLTARIFFDKICFMHNLLLNLLKTVLDLYIACTLTSLSSYFMTN